MNPNITPEFVEAHPEKNWVWGADGLSMNPFTKCILDEKRKELTKQLSCVFAPGIDRMIASYVL